MNSVWHWISVDILSEITQKSPNHVRRMYRSVIQNECIPLRDIPRHIQDIYVTQYLLRDQIVDFPFLNALDSHFLGNPLRCNSIRSLFLEMEMMRKACSIANAFSASRTITSRLRILASSYGISYSTLARRRHIYMNSTPLSRVLSHDPGTDITRDSFRTCCMLCYCLIVYLHELPGKISAAKIFRDIKKAPRFPCSKCPYNADYKNHSHKKNDYIPAITCKRHVEQMITPNCDDTVCAVIRSIPEQQDVLAWAGVRKWAALFHYTPPRQKPEYINRVWFSDHKQLDISLRTRRLPDGSWEIRRPWITAIIDAASDVMVSYVLSLHPNADCIAECFARACAFTVDTPYCGICDYFYIDNGKDYRAKKLDGYPNTEEERLYLNKDFCESGILEWFGVKVIHALPYKACSKSIESIWKTIDNEWIRKLPGYCGSSPSERPFIWNKQIKTQQLYTFEQFCDYFADTIYPEYNDFSVTKESPNQLYALLPKVNSLVPTWRTLSVLKSISAERCIRSKGIQFGNNRYYWCSELGPLVEREHTTKYRIFAFDTPFNRNISVVHGRHYIGEAHLIEKLNVVEGKRFKVIQHVAEQHAQHKFYSKRLAQIHSIVLQTDLLDQVHDVPAIDNIRYGQAIDEDRNRTDATDDNNIPEELKLQAEQYARDFLNPDSNASVPGQMTLQFREIGRKARNDHKGV